MAPPKTRLPLFKIQILVVPRHRITIGKPLTQWRWAGRGGAGRAGEMATCCGGRDGVSRHTLPPSHLFDF